MSVNEWFDPVPGVADQAASNAGQMNRGLGAGGVMGDRGQALCEDIVSDLSRSGATSGGDAVLADHVGHVKVPLDLDKLDSTEREIGGLRWRYQVR